jgi:hypothetical protein
MNSKQKFKVGDLIVPKKDLRFSVWNPGDVRGVVTQYEIQQRVSPGAMPTKPLLFDCYEVILTTGKIIKIGDFDHVFTNQMRVTLIGEGWLFASMWEKAKQ